MAKTRGVRNDCAKKVSTYDSRKQQNMVERNAEMKGERASTGRAEVRRGLSCPIELWIVAFANRKATN